MPQQRPSKRPGHGGSGSIVPSPTQFDERPQHTLATDPFTQVAASVAAGLLTASAVNISLIEEETVAAVSAVSGRTLPADVWAFSTQQRVAANESTPLS